MAGRKGLSPLFSWRSVIVESSLDATARHVALTLSLHMSERGDSCYPSLATLETETGLSRSTICKHLKVLEDVGYLRRSTGRPGHNTRYAASVPFPKDEIQERIALSGGASDGLDSAADAPEVVKKDVKEEDQPLAATPRKGKPNIVWDALVEVCGAPTTDSERGDFGKTVSELRAVIPEDATLEDVYQAMKGRRARWVTRFPDAAFTHRVLRRHWSDLGYGLHTEPRRLTADDDLEDDGTGRRTF